MHDRLRQGDRTFAWGEPAAWLQTRLAQNGQASGKCQREVSGAYRNRLQRLGGRPLTVCRHFTLSIPNGHK